MEKERILIFSAGANIHNTYSVTAENFKPDHIFVMVEQSVYDIANSEPKDENGKRRKEEMQQIVDSIKKLEEYVKLVESKRDRTVEKIILPELTQDFIQDGVISINKKYPDAEYLFNITAGTALFSTTLFIMSIWIGAEVCITRNGKDDPIYLSKPEITLEEFDKKKELKRIIKVLGDSKDKRMKNMDIMKKLIENYGTKNDKKYTGTKYERKIPKTTHWNRMEQLETYGLVKRHKDIIEADETKNKKRHNDSGEDDKTKYKKNKKEVEFSLTRSGYFMYKFIQKKPDGEELVKDTTS